MNRIVILGIALVCGLLGTFGLLKTVKPDTTEGQIKQICAANKDMTAGEVIDQSKIRMVEVPAQYAVPKSIHWQDRQAIIGQRLLGPVLKDTPISYMSVIAGANEMFERQIPKDLRALSISVSTSTGVSGLLRPGSRVDILGIFSQTIEAGNIVPTTKIKVLLQNTLVLAAGSQTTSTSAFDLSGGGRGGSYSTITVAVTLEEAEMLIAASQRGTLYCVLRNPEADPRPTDIPEKTLNEALGNAAIEKANQERFERQNKN